MKEAFEKILEFIDEQIKIEESIAKSENEGHPITHQYGANCMNVIKKFVQEVAVEYNGGWIACSERMPKERDWCLAVFEEVDTGFIGIPYIAEYLMGNHTIATTEDGWIIHNCTDIENEYAEYYKKLRCVAWQPLPEPYKVESEDNK